MRVLGVPGGSGVPVWGHRGTCGVWVSCGGSQGEYGVPVWGPGGISGESGVSGPCVMPPGVPGLSSVPVWGPRGSLWGLGTMCRVPVWGPCGAWGLCMGPLGIPVGSGVPVWGHWGSVGRGLGVPVWDPWGSWGPCVGLLGSLWGLGAGGIPRSPLGACRCLAPGALPGGAGSPNTRALKALVQGAGSSVPRVCGAAAGRLLFFFLSLGSFGEAGGCPSLPHAALWP